MKKIISALAIVGLVGCSTVTINPKGIIKNDTNPTYQESLPFFLAGIIGEREVNAKEICGKRAVKQMQTQATFLDSFLAIITLTIYTPRSVKIWCEEGNS